MVTLDCPACAGTVRYDGKVGACEACQRRFVLAKTAIPGERPA